MPKKEYDFSAFDEIESVKKEAPKEADKGEYDFSSFDTDMADLSDQEEEMGAIEAAITGLGQGASFGLSPIIGGVSGVVTEAVEDIGDVLGLTEDARLRKEGFKVEDEYEGLKGLVDAYYAQRERQKKQEEKAYEEQPAAAFGGSLLGGITSMGGAAKLASKIPSLAGILPKAESVKGLSAAQKAGVAVREGAKAGGLAGFGAGEAKLAEGEIGKAAKETAGTAIAGGLFGGALSGAGSTIGSGAKVIKDFPIFKNIKLGYTAGQKGIDISNEKQVSGFVRDTADTIRKEISKKFKGASKEALLQEADEIGIRVSIGEDIKNVIEDMKKTGAFNKEEEKILTKFAQDLEALQIGIDPDLQKAAKKVELSSAKKINKIIREGGDIETRTEFETPLEEITPLPETKGKVLGVEDLVKLKNGEKRKIITQAALEDPRIPLKQYDLENMKPSELDELKRKIGTRAFGSTEDATTPFARKVYATLKESLNSALEDSSLPEKNRKLKALYDGLDSLDIESKDFLSKREIIQDKVRNKIEQKLKASSLSSPGSKMQDFLKYIRRVDKDLADSIEGQSEFAKDIVQLVGQSEGQGSVSLKAKVFAKVGNIVGMGAKSLKESRKQSIDYLKSLTPEDVRIMSSELTKRFGEKATPYINQLNVALNSPGQRKTALLYSINQQPAFRKMLETTGKQILGESEAQASEEMQGVQNEEDTTNSTMPDTTSGIESKKKSREY